MAGDLVAELDALKVQLYQAVLETDGWASVASMLRDLVGSDFVALSLFDQRSGGHVQLHGDCGPEYKQLYTDLLDQNPFIPAIYRLRQGDILLDEAVSDRFEQTLFFDAWMRPQDQHSAAVHSLVARDGITGYFMFSRGGRSDKYSGRETVPLLALNTTLSHALGLQIRFARGQLEQTGRILNAQGVGWMAVDPGGRLVWTNQAAETMLAQPQPAVTAQHNMLRFSQPAQARRFMTALQQACVEEPMRGSGADMIATHPESGHAVALSIVPADNLFLQGLPALHGAYVGLQDLLAAADAGLRRAHSGHVRSHAQGSPARDRPGDGADPGGGRGGTRYFDAHGADAIGAIVPQDRHGPAKPVGVTTALGVADPLSHGRQAAPRRNGKLEHPRSDL
ncbi:PAS domain-containing protein [Devosia ginsengisoli]|uniref:PAS domain-containing protein n=1 Tax=Devosia ginsengisoli TaxID=400770 RepID=UPI0026EC4C06|nr:PAS domain-containing protein [Devosia ginsengisoli]MCR6672240.1 PAS domain-containing protein [Devosia ginsengisoli]